MRRSDFYRNALLWIGAVCVLVAASAANAQAPYSPSGSFMVQCPPATLLHPNPITNTGNTILNETSEPAYTGPIAVPAVGFGVPLVYVSNGGTIKCEEISGGDGMMTEADGNQTFMFSFGPLSGLGLIQNGQPGTLFAADFNHAYTVPYLLNGQPNPVCAASAGNCPTTPTSPISPTDPGANGALADPAAIMDTGVLNGNMPGPWFAFDEDDEFFLNLSNVGMIMRPDLFEQHTVHFHGYPNASSYYDGVPDASLAVNIGGTFTYYYLAPDAGTYFWHCHITPPEHLQMGMVGHLFVRPRQNRVPVGTSLFQSLAGCEPVAGVQGACGTTTSPVTGPANSLPLQVGQQSDLRTACNPAVDILCSVPLPQPPSDGVGVKQQAYAADDPVNSPTPVAGLGGRQCSDSKWGRYCQGDNFKYVYNDGDGSTRYDVDYPVHLHGFDPNFHFIGMTFNQEPFADMKDKYFLLDGRGYPDTIGAPALVSYLNTNGGALGYTYSNGVTSNTQTNPNSGVPSSESTTTNPNTVTNAISTEDSDGYSRPSQPLPSLIVLDNRGGPAGVNCTTQSGVTQQCGQRAALRFVNLSVTEYHTIASLGIPMQLIGFNAKILRDQAGNNLYQWTNSITLGGGESLDAIIDSTGVPPGTYFLYTPNLDHLSNGPENFGGMMTEIVVVSK